MAGEAGQALGVPLDYQQEAVPFALERLDGPVGRPRGGRQALAQGVHRLVMERVDPEDPRADDVLQAAAGGYVDRVGGHVGRHGLSVLDPLADRVGQVLVQRPPAGDVDHLGAAADGQDRQPASLGGCQQVELEGVEFHLGGSQQRVWHGAVGGGVDVGTSGQADAGQAVDEGVDRLGAERRYDHRDSTDRLDGL